MRQASSYGGGGGLLQTSSYEGGRPLGFDTDNLDLRAGVGTPVGLCDCAACVITCWASEDPRLLVERLFVLSELPNPGKRLLLLDGGIAIVVVLWFFNLGNAKFKFFD